MIIPNKKGALTIITGPMFAGKNEELLKQIRRVQYSKKFFLIFKSDQDSFYSKKDTVSRIINNEFASIAINEGKEIYDYLKKNEKPEVIFIDELHFFDKNIVKILNKLAKNGYQIVAAGLDQDFRGKPFKNVAYLLSLAEKIIKLSAICAVCKQDAHMTQRLTNNCPASITDPIIIIGKENIYQARCRSCHVINKSVASVVEKITF